MAMNEVSKRIVKHFTGKEVEEGKCIPEPIGCGKEIKMEDFRNALSKREFEISGLCQACQDEVFGVDDE